MLYLDYAASAPIRTCALKTLETSLRENFANPSSAHKLGKDLYKRIETCRDGFLEMMDGGLKGRFIFTSSATESNNTIINGLPLQKGDAVAISLADHPSVTAPVEHLRKKGIIVRELPLLPDGTLDEEKVLELVDSSLKLVVLTHVNNQCGSITDISLLSRKIKHINHALHIHVDAAQGFGKIHLCNGKTLIDSLCISSHKLGGPKGIAGLYLHPAAEITPLLHGGGQEEGMRSSTQPAPLVFSFYEAAKEAVESMDAAMEHVTGINRYAREYLKSHIETISFPFSETGSPYILTFLLPGISSDIILRHLEQQDIMISSTSACSSRMKGINPVFNALHIPPKDHKFVLRVSFWHETTREEVETFCRALVDVYHDLKRFIR